MELKELKVIFDSGGLKSVTIKQAPMAQGYILIAQTTSKKVHVMTSQREESEVPRAFKTIDAAVSNAQKIGFQKVTVDLS